MDAPLLHSCRRTFVTQCPPEDSNRVPQVQASVATAELRDLCSVPRDRASMAPLPLREGLA